MVATSVTSLNMAKDQILKVWKLKVRKIESERHDILWGRNLIFRIYRDEITQNISFESARVHTFGKSFRC